ncbi:MAG: 1,4-alpha-glucan branching protein GlgB [Clostridiales Family XIII bacterium]|jgi:1,4-alpha-glucan branching enzyme|nr:1,4-alpha-glucan branching protein GlgB [Clostridiales Family XIII bacterium]
MTETKRAVVLESFDKLIERFYAGEEAQASDFFGAHRVAGAADGGGDAWLFALWAPNARCVSVVGDWNGWDPEAEPMGRHRGIWVCFCAGAQAGDLYKFCVTGEDGQVRWKADPYAFRSEEPPGTASQLWELSGYRWRDASWMHRRAGLDYRKEPVSIYELHLASWRISDGRTKDEKDPPVGCAGIVPGVTAARGIRNPDGMLYPSYREAADALAAYVREMGYTHIELMPILEYPFDGSWGYQTTGYFAVTSRFGTPQDFMYFVDTMHANGIGIIVDWVPSGFPKDAHGLALFDGTRLYEHKHHLRRELPGWGTSAFILGRPEVKSFLISSAGLLLDTYHVDGIRVDAVSAMLYLDYGREGGFIPNQDGGNIAPDAVAFLRALNTSLLTRFPGALTIAEESTDFPLVTKPPHDGGLGFSLKWNMGFMHDTLDYMRTDPLFRKGVHDRMTFSMCYAFSEDYVLAYSHDEVVHGKASLLGRMSAAYDGKFDTLRALFAWQYAHPGKKLGFMGSEFAQFIEWNYKKQLDWLLLDYEKHRGVQRYVRALNRLLKRRAALHTDDGGWDGFTWLSVDDRNNSVFAFLRTCGEDRVVCVFNFTPIGRQGYVVALPAPGVLRLLLDSMDPDYSGGDYGSGTSGSSRAKKSVKAHKANLNGFEYGASLTLPPLSAMYYSYNFRPITGAHPEAPGQPKEERSEL